MRLLYFQEIRATDLATTLMGDARAYDTWASRISAGDWLGERVFYQAPLYPYFLGAIYSIFGHHLAVVRVVQALIGATSCLQLGKAGEYFFSRRVGFLSGALLALNPTGVFFDGLIQKAVLDVFFFTFALMMTGYLGRNPNRTVGWLVLGAALGALALTRENALVVLPWLLVWAWRPGGISSSDRKSWRWVGALGLGLAVVLLPVALRNLAIGGEFHLTTSQLGPNFFIGNNEHANGIYMPLRPRRGDALFEQVDATQIAEIELGHKLTPREVSDFWLAKSFEFIREHPGKWIALLGRKWLLVWNATELGDTEEQVAYAPYSPLLRGLTTVLHFGVICPLSALGVVWTWSERKRLWVLYAIALTYAASVALFFVFSRYRLPLIPIAILFAAAGIDELFRRCRDIPTTRRWAGFIVALTVAVLVNWPMMPSASVGAVTNCNLGLRLAKLGEHRRAIPYFLQALARIPNYDEAHCGLGVSLSSTGQADDAVRHLEAAIRISPRYADANFNLGVTLGNLGRLDEAAQCYRQAIELQPQRAEAYNNLAEIIAKQGNVPAAIDLLQRAVQADPNYGLAYLNLGARFVEVGRIEDARQALETSVRLQPDLWQAHFNLGRFKGLNGDPKGAVESLKRAVELIPRDSPHLTVIRSLLAEESAKLLQK